MSAPRTCIECGVLTYATRCQLCTNTTKRGYGSKWQTLRRSLLANQRCVRCGHPGSPDNPITLDHIVPKVHGGTDARSNLQPMCRRHNSSKGAR